MDYRERGSHARGVYPTQDTSSMGTVRTKQEEEAEKSNSNKYGGNRRGFVGEKVQTRPD